MPKLKTNRGAAKRFKKTAKGGSILDYIFNTSYSKAYLCHTDSKFKDSIERVLTNKFREGDILFAKYRIKQL